MVRAFVTLLGLLAVGLVVPSTAAAREVARRGIRANVVSPGDIIFPGGSWDEARQEDGKLWHAIVRENPFRRLGEPEEIADVVAFVASNRASFMTGANVLVDGGATPGIQL